jgi:DNA polymerase III epsilon subunit-like protein
MFLDTETTGLPSSNNWYCLEDFEEARVFQIACRLVDFENGVVKKYCEYVNGNFRFPENYPFDQPSAEKLQSGSTIEDILNTLGYFLQNSKCLVCHNVEFDVNILLSEAHRCSCQNFIDTLRQIPKYCTMLISMDHLKIPSQYYDDYKYPKLTELYQYCFQETFNAHDADADVEATLRCFLYMIIHGWISGFKISGLKFMGYYY